MARSLTLIIFFSRLLTPILALKNTTTMYTVNLPFRGQPSRLPAIEQNALGDFLRSDHVAFWNNNRSISAIFLSDTADHRSYMVSCYHADCDSIARVTPEMLQFLQKTSDAILATTNDVTKLSCPEKRGGMVVSQKGKRRVGSTLFQGPGK